VPGLDLAVYREMFVAEGREPDLVVTFSFAYEPAPGASEDFLEFAG